MNLFLIGFRCTGKTTVGEALAQRLARDGEAACELVGFVEPGPAVGEGGEVLHEASRSALEESGGTA